MRRNIWNFRVLQNTIYCLKNCQKNEIPQKHFRTSFPDVKAKRLLVGLHFTSKNFQKYGEREKIEL